LKIKEQPLALRNKIVTALTNWQQLGCVALKGDRFFVIRGERKTPGMHLLVWGCAKDGRAIMIWPMARTRTMPLIVAELMGEYHSRGALVGCAKNIGDAFDVVADNPREYKRKLRTYQFLQAIKRWSTRKHRSEKNGRRKNTEEE